MREDREDECRECRTTRMVESIDACVDARMVVDENNDVKRDKWEAK